MLIKGGANDLNMGLFGAYVGGHFSLVQKMIKCGATRCGYCHKTADEHRIM